MRTKANKIYLCVSSLVPGRHLIQHSVCMCGCIFYPHCLLSLVATIIFWQPISYCNSLVRGVCLINFLEFLWKFSRNTYRGGMVWIPLKWKKNQLQFISRESSYKTWILWRISIFNSTCYYCGPLVQAALLCHSLLILGEAEPLTCFSGGRITPIIRHNRLKPTQL